MKKLFAAALVALLLEGAIFARDGKKFLIFAGVDFPQSRVKVTSEYKDPLTGKIEKTDNYDRSGGLAFDVQGVAILSKGLLFLANVEIGGATFGDPDPDDNTKKNKRFLFSTEAGVGFAPVNTDKVTLGIAGVLGFGMIQYRYKGNGVTQTRKLNTFDFGADVFANVRIGKKLGIFLDTKILAGFGSEVSKTKTNGESDVKTSNKLKALHIKPTVGASFTF